MKSSPAMSKQSDGSSGDLLITSITSRATNSIRKLCVMGGLKYVFEGDAAYTSYTDWTAGLV